MVCRDPGGVFVSSLFAIAVAALSMDGKAFADEAASNGYYVGGSIGAGVGQSVGGNISSLMEPEPPPASTAGVAIAAPSLGLFLGKSWVITSGFSAGFEFEAEFQGARINSTANPYSLTISVEASEETTGVHVSNLWSVPAQAALRARASLQVTPAVSVYGSVGPDLGYARLQTTEIGHTTITGPAYLYPTPLDSSFSASAEQRRLDPGISFDAGVELAVAPNISLRGGYSLAAFKTIGQNAGAPYPFATVEVKPLFQDVRLGIVRHF
jgi:opacity protein-like surface antigen